MARESCDRRPYRRKICSSHSWDVTRWVWEAVGSEKCVCWRIPTLGLKSRSWGSWEEIGEANHDCVEWRLERTYQVKAVGSVKGRTVADALRRSWEQHWPHGRGYRERRLRSRDVTESGWQGIVDCQRLKMKSGKSELTQAAKDRIIIRLT